MGLADIFLLRQIELQIQNRKQPKKFQQAADNKAH